MLGVILSKSGIHIVIHSSSPLFTTQTISHLAKSPMVFYVSHILSSPLKWSHKFHNRSLFSHILPLKKSPPLSRSTKPLGHARPARGIRLASLGCPTKSADLDVMLQEADLDLDGLPASANGSRFGIGEDICMVTFDVTNILGRCGWIKVRFALLELVI